MNGNNKFDGPTFVNPQHTSHSLNKGNNYQTPVVQYGNDNSKLSSEKDKEKNTILKKGPRGGWDDDDNCIKESQIKHVVKSEIRVSNKNSFNKKTEIEDIPKILNDDNNSFGKMNNYWDAENTKKIQSSTLTGEYEKKLIDEILQPSGVSVKPSPSEMKDFMKRLKILNKKIVLDILFNRLQDYEENDTDAMKTLMVSLVIFYFIL